MKKTMWCVAALVSLVLAMGCKSTGKPQAGESTEDALKTVYARYEADLILDGAQKYTVVSGDMLVSIARKFYNDGFYYPIIMLASYDVVLDQDKIEPGMELTIPDLERNLADAKARASIKNFLKEIAQVEEKRDRFMTAEGLRQKADLL